MWPMAAPIPPGGAYVTTPSVVMYAPLSIVSRAGQASPFSVPAPRGHIHPGKELRDV